MPDASITGSFKIWGVYAQERGDAIEMDKSEKEEKVEESARLGLEEASRGSRPRRERFSMWPILVSIRQKFECVTCSVFLRLEPFGESRPERVRPSPLPRFE
jgi:hypothetical protein